MASAPWVALRPNNEAARPSAKGRATTIFFNNGDSTDNRIGDEAQHLALVPRIVRTHWLRPETVEAANG